MAVTGYYAWQLRGAGPAAAAAAGLGAETAFERFAARFGKAYATDSEREMRLAIFKANYATIQAENAKGHSYRLGINEFSDQTPEEFAATRFGYSAPADASALWGGLPLLGTDVARNGSGAGEASNVTEVDWSAKGAVTTPKNQKKCGSCWAFSTTGALEGAWQIATGKLVSLSEQQFIDCDHGDNACGGGLMQQAFQYAQDHAICTEASYPYEEKSGTCREASCDADAAAAGSLPKGAVLGYREVAVDDEDALLQALTKQPVSVAIEADQIAFQLYTGGVLTKECGSKLDHGVLAVGFGTENGVDYWKIKNSWGPQWGENGYIRLQRGVKGPGECGVKSSPSYPVVKQAPGSVSETVVV